MAGGLKLPRGHISGRRAGCWCSGCSLLSFWSWPSTPAPIPSSTPSRRLMRRLTCSWMPKSPVPARQCGAARAPSGSGAAVSTCDSALCASWSSVLYFALYRDHRLSLKNAPNSDPICDQAVYEPHALPPTEPCPWQSSLCMPWPQPKPGPRDESDISYSLFVELIQRPKTPKMAVFHASAQLQIGAESLRRSRRTN